MEDKLQMYNTLTRRVERFVPNVPGKVAMYTCGPTVYHFAHIGNLRSYIMEDVLEKYLRFAGYAAGIALIAAGAILIKKQRKHHEK